MTPRGLSGLVSGGIRWAGKTLFSRKRRDIESALALVQDVMLIDIGASHYLHPPWRPMISKSNIDVVAVDPDSSSLEYLEKLKVGGKLHRRVAAVGSSSGIVPFYETRVPTGSSVLQPIIPPAMQWRQEEYFDYFFPVRKTQVEVHLLQELLGPLERQQPRLIKLDTQGSELQILQSLESWFSERLVIGVELEASLLAQPVYADSPRFHQVQAWLEQRGFELIRLDVFSAKGREKNGARSYPHECDAVFGLRQDIVRETEPRSQGLLFSLYILHGLFEEAGRLLQNSKQFNQWIFSLAGNQRKRRAIRYLRQTAGSGI